MERMWLGLMGGDDWLGVPYGNGDLHPKQVTVLSVYNTKNKDGRVIGNTETGGYQLNADYNNNNKHGFLIRRNGGYAEVTSINDLVEDEYVLGGASFDNTNTNFYLNGNLESSNNSGGNHLIQYSHNNSTILGAEATNSTSPAGNYLQGDIAEILILDTALNSVQRNIYENNLASKYGLTLNGGNVFGYNENNDLVAIGLIDDDLLSYSGSSGSLRVRENNNSLNNGDIIFAGHDDGEKSIVTSDLPTGVNERFNRIWAIEKTGDVDTVVSFDLSEYGGGIVGDVNNYRLLYRNSTTGNFSEVITNNTSVNGDRIEFEVNDTDLVNGYYTLGTTDSNTSPLSVPGNITDLTASINIYDVDLSWSTPSGNPTDYLIYYSTDNFVNDINIFNDGVNTNTSTTVTGLNPATQYAFKILAVNNSGTSEFSNVAIATTTAIAPSISSIVNPEYGDNTGATAGGYDVEINGSGFSSSGYEKMVTIGNNNIDGSTSFVDTSNNPKTITANGNAQMTTSNSKFGVGALDLDGTQQAGLITSNGVSNFGTDDFTIEFWVNENSNLNNQYGAVLIEGRPDNTNGQYLSLFLNNTANGERTVGLMYNNDATRINSTNPIIASQWNHIAASRVGGTTRLFVNGNLEATTTDSMDIQDSQTKIGLHAFRTVSGVSFIDGQIDDVNILKGVGKYTANFTPSTSPNVDQTETSLLLDFEQAGNIQDLTNYQTLITLDTATLISEGKMRNDCGDLRFVDSDEFTGLPYWIESGCNTNETKVWTKIDSLPAGSTKDIYVTYGDLSKVSAETDPSNIFDFYDGFDGTEIDTGKWTSSTGTASVSDGNLVLNNSSGLIADNYTLPENTIIETRANPLSTSSMRGGAVRLATTSSAGWVNDGSANILDILWYNSTLYAETNTGENSFGSFTTGFKDYKITYRPDGVDTALFDYDNGALTRTRSGTNTPNTLKPVMYKGTGGATTALWDYIRIRQYTPTPPSITLGSEQNTSNISVDFGGNPASSFSIVNSNQIIATVPASTLNNGGNNPLVGSVDVKVSINLNDSNTSAFQYKAPEIISITPNTGATVGGNTAVLETDYLNGLISYTQEISINNTNFGTENLSDYQIKFELNTEELISTNRMRQDCGDIRILDNTQTTNLPYFIESGCNTTNTVIWTKIPSIPQNSNLTIYISYGNSNLESESNADSIFDFYDQFNSTLSPEKWISTQNVSISDACGSVSSPSGLHYIGDGTRQATTKTIDITQTVVVNFKLKYGNSSSPCETLDNNEEVVLEYSINGTNWILAQDYSPREGYLGDFVEVEQLIPAEAVSPNTQFRFRQKGNSGNSYDHLAIDDLVIYKYTSSEPSISLGGIISPYEIFIGDNKVNNALPLSSNQLLITTPANTLGTYPVKVVAQDGTESNTNILYTYESPVVTSITPNTGPDSGGTFVTISGENFSDIDLTYYQEVTINNPSGSNIVDAEVLIELDTVTPISESKMKTDCGDLRIKDNDRTTDLDYWIESGCNTDNTLVWVKIPSLPSGSDYSIYASYGDSSLTSNSNRSNFSFDSLLGNSNNILWFKGNSDDLAGISDGASINSWEDQSGKDNDAFQTNSSYYPIFSKNGQNGMSSVYFWDNGAFKLPAGIQTTPSNYTFFSVYETDETPVVNGDRYLFDTSNGQIILQGDDSVSKLDYNDGSWKYRTEEVNDDPKSVTWKLDSTNGGITYLNGETLINESGSGLYTQRAINTTNTAIGSSDAGTTSNNLEGNIYEFIAFNQALGDAERQTIESYLNQKYGLYDLGNLPQFVSTESEFAMVTLGSSYLENIQVPNSQTITGITPAGTGLVDVTVTNSDGVSGTGDDLFNYGSNNVPNPIFDLNIANIEGGTIDLSWSTPFDNGDAITDYIIKYSEDNFSTETTFNDGTNTDTNVRVTGLIPGNSYQFKVIAVNGVGNSVDSNVVSVNNLDCDQNYGGIDLTIDTAEDWGKALLTLLSPIKIS